MSTKAKKGAAEVGLDVIESALSRVFRHRCLTCKKRKTEKQMSTPDLCKECALKQSGGEIPRSDKCNTEEFIARLEASKPGCLSQSPGSSPSTPGYYFQEKRSWTKKKY